MSDNNSILVYVELDENNNVQPISLEAINFGRRIANGYNVNLSALIAGANIGDAAEELRHYDIDDIYIIENPLLKDYTPDYFVPVFEEINERIHPKGIIMGNTLTAIDLAPRIAFRLNAGLVTDCVNIEFDSDELLFTKPVYSSNIMAVFSIDTEPFIVTTRSRAAEAAINTDAAKAEIIPIEIENYPSVTTEILKRIIEEEKGPKLQNADIVVSGGRGIGGSEGFEKLRELANTLGAALGASRPPCDLDWAPSNIQVGQTGEIVGPSLYIAVAISGSTQHIAGMSGSKVIVAINTDANANIFKIADYGIIGNYEEVIPAFMGTLNEI